MRTLLSAEQIADRVAELGTELSQLYADRPLTVVGILSGSILFLADLMRQLKVPHQVGFLQAASYRTGTTAGQLSVNPDYFPDVAGRDILLIDDIFDTGQTLKRLTEMIRHANPHSVRTAVLLWKEGTQRVSVSPDFYGFRIPDQFVVGYGLDFNQDYRHLPHLAVLEDTELSN